MRTLSILAVLAVCVLVTGQSHADLLGYWDLNTATEDMADGTIFNADQGTGTITLGTNNPRWDATGGSTVNLLAPSAAGQALDVSGGEGSDGASFDIAIDASDFADLVLTFALDVDTNGHVSNQLSYSVDGGGNFTDFGGTFPGGTTPTYELETFDLSSIPALNLNADVVLRITLGGGNGFNPGRASQWDNFQVNGTFIPEPASLMLLAVGSAAAIARRRRGGKRAD